MISKLSFLFLLLLSSSAYSADELMVECTSPSSSLEQFRFFKSISTTAPDHFFFEIKYRSNIAYRSHYNFASSMSQTQRDFCYMQDADSSHTRINCNGTSEWSTQGGVFEKLLVTRVTASEEQTYHVSGALRSQSFQATFKQHECTWF
jgi:hypothetical protein